MARVNLRAAGVFLGDVTAAFDVPPCAAGVALVPVAEVLLVGVVALPFFMSVLVTLRALSEYPFDLDVTKAVSPEQEDLFFVVLPAAPRGVLGANGLLEHPSSSSLC